MNRQDDMLMRMRSMAVFYDGIWQRAEGVWVSLSDPYKARVILNGKEMFFEGKTFIDYDGYSENDIYYEIIQRNISTLPRLKKKQRTLDQPRTVAPWTYRQYRIVNRNGRPHAVPYPEPERQEFPDEPPHTIVFDAPPTNA